MKQAKLFLFLLWLVMGYGCINKSTNETDLNIDKIFTEAKINARSLQKPPSYYIDKAEAYSRLPASNESKAKIEYVKAVDYRKKKQIDSSLTCFENGFSYLKKDTPLKFFFCINAARDAAELNHVGAFNKYLAEANKLSKKLKDPSFEAGCFGAQGLFLMFQEKYKEGQYYILKADSILEINGIKEDRDSYLYMLAAANRRMGFISEAYKYYVKSMNICNETGNSYCLLKIYLNISRIYRDERRYEKALQWQVKHLQLTQNIYAPVKRRESYEGMGIIYTEMKDWANAEVYFNKSIEYAKELNNNESLSVAFTNYANFCRLKGDYETAISYYHKAYEYKLKGNANSLSLVRCVNSLGKAYMYNGNFVMAKKYLNIALELSDSLKSLQWESIINKSFFELYKKDRNYPAAIKYVTNYLTLKNEVDKRKASDKLQKLMVDYEMREKDYTITLQKQEIKNKSYIIAGVTVALGLIVTIIILIILNKRIRETAIQSIYKQNLEAQQRQKLIDNLLKEQTILPVNLPENQLMTNLLRLLDNEQIFRNPDLSLEGIATQLNTNTTYVSQLINKQFGCNFNVLINRYRIDFCKNRISETKRHNLLMKQVAFDAGFSSRSTFYSAFKNEVGITPTQFKKVCDLENK
ncbi:tetratricopeptide repeat protein [Geofilum sp. OHC36d9]|uniref:tetratricopeptide repeat protein n=1 Tax=Geofilum sp. OHC36d9 TaxID=3458413 RepID=UPI004033E782